MQGCDSIFEDLANKFTALYFNKRGRLKPMQVCFSRITTILFFMVSITSCEKKQADIPPISFEENLQQQLIEA